MGESLSLSPPLAVITGASSGIGAAVARFLAYRGYEVVLTARRRERLEALAAEIQAQGGCAQAVPTDLTRESERVQLLHQAGEAQVLINNAGLGWYGYGAEMSWQTAWEILQVNVEAVVQLTLGFLRNMRRRGRGHIINIGSISGSLPSQGIAVYGASKSFLDNFTTALYRELNGSGVYISVVRAGPVKTEFSLAALRHERAFPLPTERLGIAAEAVAACVWDLLRRPRRVTYLPPWLRLVPWLELSFGWLIDRLGPLLLKRHTPVGDDWPELS